MSIRDDREWLFIFPFPPIPIWSIPIHSHSQFCNQFPFPWDSHWAIPIPIPKQLFSRCGINIFGISQTRLTYNKVVLSLSLNLTVRFQSLYNVCIPVCVVYITGYYHYIINCTVLLHKLNTASSDGNLFPWEKGIPNPMQGDSHSNCVINFHSQWECGHFEQRL